MEDSSTTDATLELYRALRADGHDGVGIVLQAALRRTLSDIEALAPLEPSVRLCKGIYVEPPSIAFQDFDDVRSSFVALPRRAARAPGPRRDRDARRVAHRAGARAGRRARARRATSSRCSSASAPTAPASSSPPGIRCGSTCRTASSGTSTRSAGSRRTRRSPATSRRTSWRGSSRQR